MTQRAAERDYERALRAAGVRITRQRRIILQILSEATDHPDAMELYQRATSVDDSISLTTVYRTLKLLADKGEIHRHAFEGINLLDEPKKQYIPTRSSLAELNSYGPRFFLGLRYKS